MLRNFSTHKASIYFIVLNTEPVLVQSMRLELFTGFLELFTVNNINVCTVKSIWCMIS